LAQMYSKGAQKRAPILNLYTRKMCECMWITGGKLHIPVGKVVYIVLLGDAS